MPVDNEMYDRLADTWWRKGSAFSNLDRLNPGRFAYLDGLLARRDQAYSDLEVLDLGCGGGLMSEAYARRSARVTGVDPSRNSLEAARAHAAESGLTIRYVEGRGESMPLPDASFDLVSCCDVLEHVGDLDAVSREIARLLRPRGFFFFDTINRTWLAWLFLIKVTQDWARVIPERTHDWEMFITPDELRASLQRAGLRTRHVTGLGPRPIRPWFGPSPFTAVLYMGWATPISDEPTRA